MGVFVAPDDPTKPPRAPEAPKYPPRRYKFVSHAGMSRARTGVDEHAPIASRSVSNYELWKQGAFKRGGVVLSPHEEAPSSETSGETKP